jgi:hypothetical protein
MHHSCVNTFIVVLLFAAVTFAGRSLDRGEILKLTQDLTDHPARTWIAAGTLYARHTRYRAPEVSDANAIQRLVDEAVKAYLADPQKPETTSFLQQMRLDAIPFNVRYRLTNEYTMTSHVVLRFDGTRFCWEIVVDSRQDTLAVPPELEDNWYAHGFDLQWNQRRVFAWDGEKYVTYFRSGNQAVITGTPSGVHGPLTAGIIPWGYGAYSYETLSASQVSGMLTDQDGSPVLHLTIARDDHTEDFEFSGARPNVLLSYTRTSAKEQIRHAYGDYMLAGDRSCPKRIMIERFDGASPGRLLASDTWEILAIDAGDLPPESFDVEYDCDALIEDYRFGAAPLTYRYAAPMLPSARDVRIEQLLRQRLEILRAPDPSGQNCATACLKYVCDRLGVRPSGDDLRALIQGPGMETTMLQMREFLGEHGLNAVAVNATVDKLALFADCQVILHLDDQNHYVVLGGVDKEFVRLIDLDRNGFYYRVPAAQFAADKRRAALLVSDRPVVVAGDIARIDSSSLEGIAAAGSCQDCNTKIQSASAGSCIEVAGICGNHTQYYERWACGTAQSGSCKDSDMVMHREENCERDPATGLCAGDGDWTSSSGKACK